MTTVLIVDDSRLARDMVSSVIKTLQPEWTVIASTGGEDALAKVVEQSPDLAILDYNMPGMDGLTLAEKLRERFLMLPIAILTANVQDALRRRAEDLGCWFLTKPVTADKIRDLFVKTGIAK
jgi:two-component system, chemotaxis family, chemotaxis protein CheY